MEAAKMTFAEEVVKLRSECKYLRQENARLKRQNQLLTGKMLLLEQENMALRKENSLLKEKQLLLLEKQTQQEKEIESLNLIVEELRRMVFGKKKTKDNGENNGSGENTTAQDAPIKKRKWRIGQKTVTAVVLHLMSR